MTALPRSTDKVLPSLKLPEELREKKNGLFRQRARFVPADYDQLIEPFRKAGYEIVRLRDVFCDSSLHGKKLFSLRHDVDHDWETALRMAAWEHAHGYRATYCVLHTSWYYGEFHEGRYAHYEEFIDFCRQLEQMDHEINLHNNFVTLALTTGFDLKTLITNELAALRSYGLNIVGSSTHGDALCQKVGFYNFEAFEGRAWDSKGGPRPVTFEETTVQLGSVSMDALGLAYEAYDYPRDVYMTDSGGRLRLRRSTRGLRGYCRGDDGIEIPSPSNCGLLTHPIWWDMEEPRTVQVRGFASNMLRLSGLNEDVLMGEAPHERPAISTRSAGFDHGFAEPVLHRALLDHILYLAPADLPAKRFASLFSEDEDFDAFAASWRQYEIALSEDARNEALRAYRLCRPNPDLILEFCERNLEKLFPDASRKGAIDSAAISAMLLGLTRGYEGTGDQRFLEAAAMATERLLEGGILFDGGPTDSRPNSIGVVGRIAYPLLKLLLIATGDGAEAPPSFKRTCETMREAVLTFDTDLIEFGGGRLWYRDEGGGLADFADVNALVCAQLMIAAREDDETLRNRVERLWAFFRSRWWWYLTEGRIGWPHNPDSKDPDDEPARSAIWSAFLAQECLDHALVTDATVIDRILASFLRPAADEPAVDGGPEGPARILAWGRFVKSNPDLSSKLERLALEPELGNWFRHPWGVLAYADRLSMFEPASETVEIARKRETG